MSSMKSYRLANTKRSRFKIRLKKGDVVMVRAGSQRGKTGKITATHPQTNMVTIEGINVVKRHQKPNKAHTQGGIIEMTKPMLVSKVSLFDPATKKPSRIGMKLHPKTNAKIRVLKTTGKEVKS